MSAILFRSQRLRGFQLILGLAAAFAAAGALLTGSAIAQEAEQEARLDQADIAASYRLGIEQFEAKITSLQEQLIRVLSGEQSEESRAAAQGLREKIAEARTQLQRRADSLAKFEDAQTGRTQQAELEKLRSALAERETQLRTAHEQLAQVEREREQPVENADVRIFRLKNINAGVAADTIDSVVPGRMRLAVDANTNSVIASASAETMETILALLTNLDTELPAGANNAPPSSPTQKSLLIRVILLAGANDGEGQPANSILPQSVLTAVEKLGFAPERVLGQSVCTVTGSDDAHAKFSSQTDVMVRGAPVMLRCVGYLGALNGGAAPLDLEISLQSNSISTNVNGSLTTPLGHYMVLGTANAVSPVRSDSQERPEAVREQQEAERNADDERGRPRGGFGGRGGGFGGGPRPIEAPTEYQTSRFVFVVQVLEAESFAPNAE